MIFIGGGGGMPLGAMGALALLAAVLGLVVLAVLALRALGEALLGAWRRRRADGGPPGRPRP